MEGGMRAVIFDLDGTLQTLELDFETIRAGLEALLSPLLPPSSRLLHGPILEAVDGALARALEMGVPPKEILRARAAAMELMERAELASLPRSRVLPGARETLAALSGRGLKIAILSRACRKYVEASAARLGTQFDALASREDVARYKPDPAPVLFLAERMGVMPAECAVVGDHPFDMEAGRRAGARCAGVLTGSGNREQLVEAGAEAVFEGLGEELVEWLCAGREQLRAPLRRAPPLGR